ncbi:lactate permease [Kyrpidia spormannii]|uniref:L-lactate permease n=2 Tax=Kyrpidia spormannii TaxID=2055160 RepID=A0A2K8NAV8_9BACL|nr:lactate permease LctP family transporter [Kyrpidia spormannii]ATY85750.1 lactate permease [Kyrpidia spormannii]CAB3394402.1 L-lactate permease [Kyrpidia spormannii]CAB3395345.1 L-lactate permease [Kyrpidia spormannii]
MSPWHQVYYPVGGSLWLSALVAVIPIAFFFWALAVRRMKGHVAGLLTLLLAVILAIIVNGMPIPMAVSTAIYGMLSGLWPIGWIVFTAVFLYNITEESGYFRVIRDSITGLTGDRRMQALLIAFSFSAFMEGSAGFGTPVAIAAAILAGLGFNPLYAAGICLVANSAPVAFGAIGIPITTAAQVTGMDAHTISQVVGRQLPILSLFLPFWLVLIMSGWKRTIEVLPAILISGGSFAITQFLVSNFVGPELPDIASAFVSLIALALFLRVWRPKEEFHFADEKADAILNQAAAARQQHSSGDMVRAWAPWVILTVMIIIWSLPAFKSAVAGTTIAVNWPWLNKLVVSVPPVAAKNTPMAAVWKFDWLGATGTSILIASILSMFVVGMSVGTWFKVLVRTFRQLLWPLVTIAAVLGFGHVTNYSSMSATIALALAGTGVLFPLFSPVLGWLGVFLTGSDTSSNVLFGNLQKITAQQLGLNPYLMVGANSSGGVTGKMISPQSIAVGASATGLAGREGEIYRFTLKHSILFVLIVSVITMIEAYVFPGLIPK